MKGDIAVIGLAVMGQNLILNMADHGFTVVAYNRTTTKVGEFLEGAAAGKSVVGANTLEDMVSKLKSPRKVMLMVRAGTVVDQFIEALIPLLSKGDIIIDGGNSNFHDTTRRVEYLSDKGIHFLGAGVSGGEEGARHGPSIMPGGSTAAWPAVQPIFQSIAAKTASGEACCDWVGEGGAGHFVKMVHNGIEYGDMQLIAESYHFMHSALQIDHDEMAKVFSHWNQTELESYLIEINADIFAYKDNDGSPLLEKILDKAGQKGTGKWTGINALDLGVPLTLISESVFARCISSLKVQRVEAEKAFSIERGTIDGESSLWVEKLRQALLASKIVSYAQGFMLMREASDEYLWELNYGSVAMMWREGCIIRSVFLENIRDAFDQEPDLSFLGLNAYFKDILKQCLPAWREIVAESIKLGIPMPCMSSAISFLDAYTTANLPANLIQAQRDYFGAHTYEHKDGKAGEHHHTDWSGSGGAVSSSSYDV